MPFKFEKRDLWKQSLDYTNAANEIADRSTGQSDKEQSRFLGIQLTWQGEGPNEKGIVAEIDEKSFDKTMSKHLNSSTLGWQPEFMIDDVVKDMVGGDFKKIAGITKTSEVSE